MLFAECTKADASYDAARLNEAFAGQAETVGALIEDLSDRLQRFHYDLCATPAFHADEVKAIVGDLVSSLHGTELFAQDCHAGADPAYRLPIRARALRALPHRARPRLTPASRRRL